MEIEDYGTPDDSFARLPPHSIDAEKCLLASLMLIGDDEGLFKRTTAAVERDDFFQADHQVIYAAILDVRRRAGVLDAIMLRENLADKAILDEVGGQAYLGELLDTVPSSYHAEHYARIVRERSLQRRLIDLSAKAAAAARGPFYGDESVRSIIGRLAQDATALLSSGQTHDVHRIGDVMAAVVRSRDEHGDIIRTGISSIDKAIGGLELKMNHIIAGPPGMGKSAYAKQILLSLAAAGVSVGLITVEESKEKVAKNMLSNLSGVANNRIAHKRALPEEWAVIGEVAAGYGLIPFHVVDSANRLSAIEAMADLLAVKHGCRVIAVDHIHLIDSEAKSHANREQQIARISMALKQAWRRLNVAGICCAQLNRGSGKDRPTLNSLRDSGTLGQDADVVMLLYREDYFRKKEGRTDELDGLVEVIIAKSKNGPEGIVTLAMDEECQRITDREETISPEAMAAVDYFSS